MLRRVARDGDGGAAARGAACGLRVRELGLGEQSSGGARRPAHANRLGSRGVTGEGGATVANRDRQRPWRRLGGARPRRQGSR
eukprot:COSAG02_NODE_16_length_56207_cov_9.816122_18_plen_83_part_00